MIVSNGKFPIFPGLMIALALALSACRLFIDESATSTASVELAAMSVRSAWPTAISIAQGWQEDAYVREISLSVKLPNSSLSYSRIKFLFDSPSEDSARFVVTCDQVECKSFEVKQEEGYPVLYCSPVHLEDFKLDSQEVLEIGLQKGCTAFVDREAATAELSLSYGTGFCGHRLFWGVQFTDLSEFPYEYLQLFLDPNTGEEIDIGP
jgi:hypothetical protein